MELQKASKAQKETEVESVCIKRGGGEGQIKFISTSELGKFPEDIKLYKKCQKLQPDKTINVRIYAWSNGTRCGEIMEENHRSEKGEEEV